MCMYTVRLYVCVDAVQLRVYACMCVCLWVYVCMYVYA